MKKYLIFLFLLVALLFIPNTASAAEVIGNGECSYSFSNSIFVDKYSTNSGKKITFYFTEIYMVKKAVTRNKLFVKDSSYDNYFSNVTGLGTAAGYSILKDKSVSEISGAVDTFFQKVNDTNACPEYLMFKESGKKYIPYFGSEEQVKFYCGDDKKSCFAISSKTTKSSFSKVYTDEKTWKFSTNGEDGCDQFNAKLYLEEDGKLRAIVWYPGSSSYYEKSAKKEVYVDVKITPSEQANTQYQYARNLVLNGKIEKAMVRGDKGNEKVILNDEGVSKHSCDLASNKSATPVYDCVTYDSFKSTLTSKKQAVTNANATLNSSTSSYATYNAAEKTYNPITFNDVTDVSTLTSAADSINEDIETAQSAIDAWNTYAQEVDKKDLCTDAREKFISDQESVQSTVNLMSNKITALKGSLENIQKRLGELNAEEEAETLDEYIDTAGDTIDSAEETKAFVPGDPAQVGIDVNLTAKTGCGLLGTELTDILQTILDYIRIAGIALAVILQIADYIKAIFGSSDDSMAKANKRFSTRLIAIGLLFLIPSILNFILALFNIAGTGDAGTCGIF